MTRPEGICAACGHPGGLHYGPEGVCVADCRSLSPLIQCGCKEFVALLAPSPAPPPTPEQAVSFSPCGHYVRTPLEDISPVVKAAVEAVMEDEADQIERLNRIRKLIAAVLAPAVTPKPEPATHQIIEDLEAMKPEAHKGLQIADSYKILAEVFGHVQASHTALSCSGLKVRGLTIIERVQSLIVIAKASAPVSPAPQNTLVSSCPHGAVSQYCPHCDGWPTLTPAVSPAPQEDDKALTRSDQAVWDAAWALHDPDPNGQQWRRSKALKDAIDVLIEAEGLNSYERGYLKGVDMAGSEPRPSPFNACGRVHHSEGGVWRCAMGSRHKGPCGWLQSAAPSSPAPDGTTRQLERLKAVITRRLDNVVPEASPDYKMGERMAFNQVLIELDALLADLSAPSDDEHGK